ncbi:MULTISPECIES: GNAT family N-acetyltransferase [Streptomyces]|uniref:N-acetyltransferase n=1 Tax=Streptomyces lasiicapitis TaxID=1923961 RepID=A0ABQ2LHZ9_9ACTN|nr:MULTISPECIES: GNAT family N-acetyltransferase [Streptomyces]QIB43633.1 GNAT family N-acetyltransferase [Streptomyces aureoverticillatus]GGO33857.1 N-acetyltransferase [Streptomyces lasiicapitis]
MGVAIRRAGASDRADAVGLLDEAFMADPVSSWLFPGEERRRSRHGALMAAFVDLAFAEGHVDIAEDGSAVALWWSVPAGEAHEDAAEGAAQLRQAVDPDNERVEVIARLTSEVHPTDRPHQYLHMIAVKPEQQGEGLGTALVAPVLARCDRDGRHAYLEASNARSRELYLRLGFADLGTAFDLPDGPRMWPMWREPQSV